MFENNNKEVVERLTKRSLRSNKLRNIFVILAIILTTFMTFSIFSIGFSFYKNYSVMMLRLQGSTANVLLNNPSENQIKEIKDLKEVKNVGEVINFGSVIDKTFEEKHVGISMDYYDSTVWKEQVAPALDNINGNYPSKENEIMASLSSLELLGIKSPKIGMDITLNYKCNKQEYNKTFKLVGYYEDFNYFSDVSKILVSKELLDKNNITSEDRGTAYLTINKKYKEVADEVLNNKVTLKDNQEFNFNYDMTEEASDTVVPMIIIVSILCLFIVLSGYLLIYNVLYISVVKDIQFYGLLKTIGTSPKQIKKIVKGQAFKLSFIGIPLGLVLGILVSFVIIPVALKMFSSGMYAGKAAMPSDISFNPIIIIGSILFSLLTIYLSCRKPAKFASSISPIEAIKFTGVKENNKKKTRNSTNGGKIYKMAFYNVFRYKKRAFIVFLSLFMGIITFLSVDTFISSLKVENYLNTYVPNDFKIENTITDNQVFNDDFMNYLRNKKGVKNISKTYIDYININYYEELFNPFINSDFAIWGDEESKKNFIESLKNKTVDYESYVFTISSELVEKMNKNLDNPINIDDFKNGKIALLGNYGIKDEYKEVLNKLIGKKFKIKSNKSNIEMEYEFGGVAEGDLPHGPGTVLGAPVVYISEEAINKLNPSSIISSVTFDVEEKYEPAIKEELKNKFDGNGKIIITAKSDESKNFETTSNIMNILGGGLSLILILIGILNFINIMISGVNSRIKELTVMESIGMTKNQIYKMLTFEGLYYAGITTALIGTLGIGIIFSIAKLTQEIADYATFTFPAVILIILVSLIFIICLVTPRIVYKVFSKESVTERLRKTES